MTTETVDMIAAKFGDSPAHAARWLRTLHDIVSLPTAIDCPDCDGCGVPIADLMALPVGEDPTPCPRCSGTGVTTATTEEHR